MHNTLNNRRLVPPHERRPRRPRRALTLAEVLIAMGLLTVGLLGVAAIFPVGGHYMQSGDVADRGGAIAQAALEDAITRGYLDPDSWVVHDGNSYVRTPGSPRFVRQGALTRFMRLTTGVSYNALNLELASSLPNERYGLRQILGLKDDETVDAILGSDIAPTRYRETQFGDAFVIDPIGLAGALEDDIVGRIDTSFPVRHFPGFPGPFSYDAPQWAPWHNNGAFWPVRRVSTVHYTGALNSLPYSTLQEPIATESFATDDDLALTLPDSGDSPARQTWEAWSNAGGVTRAAAGRQARRDYSWLISVALPSSAARDALGAHPDAYPVEVSAVVFHKRTPAHGSQAVSEAERLVKARVVNSGPSGGELLLTKRTESSEPSPSPFEDLREGEYVMVVGPHPLSTDTRPMLALRWCRVLRLQDTGAPRMPDGTQPTLDRDNRVLVALRGPDWPWKPAENQTDTSLLSNDLRVAILPGAVAVHTQTMRLEAGSEWSID